MKKIKTLIVILTCLLLVNFNGLPSFAKDVVQPKAETPQEPQTIANAPTEDVTDAKEMQIAVDQGTKEFYLPGMVLLFGLIVFSLLFFSSRRNSGETENEVKIQSITLIVVGVLFIISIGNSATFAKNITSLYAPAFGLLGTMVGYIFAKSQDKVKKD